MKKIILACMIAVATAASFSIPVKAASVVITTDHDRMDGRRHHDRDHWRDRDRGRHHWRDRSHRRHHCRTKAISHWRHHHRVVEKVRVCG